MIKNYIAQKTIRISELDVLKSKYTEEQIVNIIELVPGVMTVTYKTPYIYLTVDPNSDSDEVINRINFELFED